MTISFVGLMMNVGSMRGACNVGGRKGVAVRAGEQAEARRSVNVTVSRLRRSMMRRITYLNNKGGRFAVRLEKISFLFFVRTSVCVTYAHLQREGDLSAQGFLADDRVELVHQIRILTEVILGILASLAESDVAIGEERTALLNDFELGGEIEHVT